jgi:hypothetical protein
MSEVLAPTLINIESAFTHGFSGMTRDPVELADLLAARVALIESVVGGVRRSPRISRFVRTRQTQLEFARFAQRSRTPCGSLAPTKSRQAPVEQKSATRH